MKTVILPLLKTDLSKNNKGRKNNLPTMIDFRVVFCIFALLNRLKMTRSTPMWSFMYQIRG